MASIAKVRDSVPVSRSVGQWVKEEGGVLVAQVLIAKDGLYTLWVKGGNVGCWSLIHKVEPGWRLVIWTHDHHITIIIMIIAHWCKVQHRSCDPSDQVLYYNKSMIWVRMHTHERKLSRTLRFGAIHKNFLPEFWGMLHPTMISFKRSMKVFSMNCHFLQIRKSFSFESLLLCGMWTIPRDITTVLCINTNTHTLVPLC